LEAEAGTLQAPFAVTGSTPRSIVQRVNTVGNVPAGGRASYTFTAPTTADYTINATVNAPNDMSNSFSINIDAEPTEPVMIWDIPITSGFASRTVAWRGTGTTEASQYVPKVFHLSAGTHTLIIRGREPNTLLDTLSISAR
jgi:hypothetical protein